MAVTVGIRELANNTSGVVEEVRRSGRPAFVTRHGRPVAVLYPLDEDALLDHVLANAPEYVADMRRADALIAAGARGITHDELVDALDDDAALDRLAAEAEQREQAALEGARPRRSGEAAKRTPRKPSAQTSRG